MNDARPFYTLDEAAQLLNVSRDYLRRLVAKGDIKGYKRLKQWYLLTSDILEYLKAGKPSTDK